MFPKNKFLYVCLFLGLSGQNPGEDICQCKSISVTFGGELPPVKEISVCISVSMPSHVTSATPNANIDFLISSHSLLSFMLKNLNWF